MEASASFVGEGIEDVPSPSLFIDVISSTPPPPSPSLFIDVKTSTPPPSDYIIGGVKVQFPCRAYSSQVAMMGKIISGLQRGQNSLIESPTGSGKTLALLCSTIAWQRLEAEKLRKLAVEEYAEELKRAKEKEAKKMEKIKKREELRLQEEKAANRKRMAEEAIASPVAKKGDIDEVLVIEDSDDDDDFVKPINNQKVKLKEEQDYSIKMKGKDNINNGGLKISVVEEAGSNACEGEDEEDSMVYQDASPLIDEEGTPTNSIPKVKIPKIYFGTRTHKQIEQVVRELKKTAYNNVRMTILSSREHTCLQNKPRHLSSKTELCHELLEQAEKKTGPGCMYHRNVRMMGNHNYLMNSGLSTPWDIEDLNRVGKKARCCPYFTARELMSASEIVFCPYNYLISPLIRKSMDIQLRGEVVILDEAHNMEDAAREAASLSLDLDTILDSMNDCEKVVSKSSYPDSYSALAQFLSTLSGWMDKNKDSIQDYKDYNQASQVWTGTQIAAVFSNLGIGEDRYPQLKEHLDLVIAASMKTTEDDDYFSDEEITDFQSQSMTSATRSTLENIFLILNFLIGNAKEHRDDYRIALVRSISRDFRAPVDVGGGWMKAKSKTYSRWKLTLNFWCLNAAVAFRDVSDSTRSIVLTSGTLAPVESFQSELGTPFPIRLEANHVIDKSQVYVATVGCGPNNVSLNATYRNAETFDFQDEVGQVVLNVCKAVPHGVLCFLSSYNLMEKLLSRWQMTGLYDTLSCHKIVFNESRGRGGDEFEQTLRDFYKAIEMTSKSNDEGPTGPLLLAVCRGKVSEGLDFADNNARAVITIGIPYPNFKDTQVELKRKFNDSHCVNRGLLNGSDWYEIQAYRALNQALGRCIRHRNDWGAIILIDDRFSKNKKYTQGLSKWIRNMVLHYPSWKSMYDGLESFVQKYSTSSINF